MSNAQQGGTAWPSPIAPPGGETPGHARFVMVWGNRPWIVSIMTSTEGPAAAVVASYDPALGRWTWVHDISYVAEILLHGERMPGVNPHYGDVEGLHRLAVSGVDLDVWTDFFPSAGDTAEREK